jgi:hypothetical protein
MSSWRLTLMLTKTCWPESEVRRILWRPRQAPGPVENRPAVLRRRPSGARHAAESSREMLRRLLATATGPGWTGPQPRGWVWLGVLGAHPQVVDVFADYRLGTLAAMEFAGHPPTWRENRHWLESCRKMPARVWYLSGCFSEWAARQDWTRPNSGRGEV